MYYNCTNKTQNKNSNNNNNNQYSYTAGTTQYHNSHNPFFLVKLHQKTELLIQ